MPLAAGLGGIDVTVAFHDGLAVARRRCLGDVGHGSRGLGGAGVSTADGRGRSVALRGRGRWHCHLGDRFAPQRVPEALASVAFRDGRACARRIRRGDVWHGSRGSGDSGVFSADGGGRVSGAAGT